MACPITYSTHRRRGEQPCDECRAAQSRQSKLRKYREDLGLPTTDLVDAGPVREHLAALEAADITTNQVGYITGLPPDRIAGIVRPVLGGPFKRVHRRTRDLILAVPIPTWRERIDMVSENVLISAVGTRRRMQALATIGYGPQTVLLHAGRSGKQAARLLDGRAKTVTAGVARAVRAAYDELWDNPPTPTTPGEIGHVTRMKNRAKKAGWATPLMWDDDSIDNPHARPKGRAKPSKRPQPVNLDDVAELLRLGEHPENVARRVGRTVNYLERRAYDVGRTDVVRLLGIKEAA